MCCTCSTGASCHAETARACRARCAIWTRRRSSASRCSRARLLAAPTAMPARAGSSSSSRKAAVDGPLPGTPRLTIRPRPPLGGRAELLDERGEALSLGLELAHDAVALRFGAALPRHVSIDADRHPDRATAVENGCRLDRDPSFSAAEAKLDAERPLGDDMPASGERTWQLRFGERPAIDVEDLDPLEEVGGRNRERGRRAVIADRKSTRLNSS